MRKAAAEVAVAIQQAAKGGAHEHQYMAIPAPVQGRWVMVIVCADRGEIMVYDPCKQGASHVRVTMAWACVMRCMQPGRAYKVVRTENTTRGSACGRLGEHKAVKAEHSLAVVLAAMVAYTQGMEWDATPHPDDAHLHRNTG